MPLPALDVGFCPSGAAERASRLRQVAVACLMAALLALPALAAEPSIPAAGDSRPLAEKAQAAVSKGVVLEQATVAGAAAPRPIPQTITRFEAQAVDPDGREPLDHALACLARTIYWEARGKERPGMEAVASVVMSRLGKESFPSTVCGVETEGSQTGTCQFSWWCDGRPDEVEEANHYAITMEVAREALNRQLPDRTDGALYSTMAASRQAGTTTTLKPPFSATIASSSRKDARPNKPCYSVRILSATKSGE